MLKNGTIPFGAFALCCIAYYNSHVVLYHKEVMYVKSDDFEKAFNDFLERKEYDNAENALFGITRAAFAAGWLAAGGEALKPQKIFEIMRNTDKDNSTDK